MLDFFLHEQKKKKKGQRKKKAPLGLQVMLHVFELQHVNLVRMSVNQFPVPQAFYHKAPKSICLMCRKI